MKKKITNINNPYCKKYSLKNVTTCSNINMKTCSNLSFLKKKKKKSNELIKKNVLIKNNFKLKSELGFYELLQNMIIMIFFISRIKSTMS